MNGREIPRVWASATDVLALVHELGETTLAVDIDRHFADGVENTAAVRAMVERGLFGLTLPRRYGGMGRDYTALAAACEALGAIDTAHQVSLTVHLALAGMSILQWGAERQRQQWLPALTSGERLATFGLTEPDAGSDVGALRMRARRVPGGFVLNGEKAWISAADQANLFVLFATVDPTLRHKGITAFIVPRESAGLSTIPLRGKFGLRAGDTGSVFCQDVYVPEDQVLGNVGEGFAIALAALGNGLFTVGCGALGVARACREWTAAFLQQLGAHGEWELGILAQMVVREEVSRLLLARAASLKNVGVPNAQQTSLAKWRAAEAGVANADAALRLWSVNASGEQAALLRHLANAKGAVIYGGTSEIHQVMQGDYALGHRTERPFRCPSPDASALS